ncbi:MAG: glycosyltransferase [Saccharofermentans sp.]|nr:glycosyltransferase [Saccharofermentans sp.]
MAGFFPGEKYGGPPVSIDNFCSLMREFKVYIVTHNHDKGECVPYEGIPTRKWVERDNCKVMYLDNSQYNGTMFKRIIHEIQPDILYLQGLFQSCIIPCLRIAKRKGLKVILAPRGELCEGAFKKKYKKIPYIQLLRVMGLLKGVVFQSTSEEETDAIGKYLGVNDNRICFTTNIPSFSKNKPNKVKKITGRAKFVFISRIHPKKNLLQALKCLKSVTGKCVFDIYGPIEDEAYWNKCRQVISSMSSDISVNYCGVLSHSQTVETFGKYDAFIFPTFSENYGHVISESLMSGCIPIISDQTPWTDVNNYQAGWALPISKDDEIIDALQLVVSMNDDRINEIRDNIRRYLNDKIKLEEIHRVYYSMFIKGQA